VPVRKCGNDGGGVGIGGGGDSVDVAALCVSALPTLPLSLEGFLPSSVLARSLPESLLSRDVDVGVLAVLFASSVAVLVSSATVSPVAVSSNDVLAERRIGLFVNASNSADAVEPDVELVNCFVAAIAAFAVAAVAAVAAVEFALTAAVVRSRCRRGPFTHPLPT
jgi:hypothetical protein